MKFLKTLSLAAMFMLVAGTAHAQSHTSKIYKDSNGAREVIANGGTLKVQSGGTVTMDSGSTVSLSGTNAIGGTIATQGTAFSTGTTGNPLMQVTVQDVPVASVNAAGGYKLVSGVSGRTIYPAGLSIMVSGSAASATRLMVICSSGNILASVPIAYLVDKIAISPFQPFSSTTIATGANFTSTAFARGCASGDSVLVSNVGSNMSTTTDIFINMPYTIQ